MWPLGHGLIQTSFQAGGIASATMRSRCSSSVILARSRSRYTKPRPARRRVQPGASMRTRRSLAMPDSVTCGCAERASAAARLRAARQDRAGPWPKDDERTVAVRFNPPPNWPVEPGFVPRRGWAPDPAWPRPPAGWRTWLPDEPDVVLWRDQLRAVAVLGAGEAVTLAGAGGAALA